jgi:hypothetical protein
LRGDLYHINVLISLAIGQDSVANGKNGHEGGLAIGAGSNAMVEALH